MKVRVWKMGDGTLWVRVWRHVGTLGFFTTDSEEEVLIRYPDYERIPG